jgi:hypothetical protein
MVFAKNTDILQRATAVATLSQGRAVMKTGAKRSVVRVPKLNDANWRAPDLRKCTLS